MRRQAQAAAGPAVPAPAVADAPALVGVSQFVAEAKLDTVDFLKVDTDGTDFEVLISAADVFASHRLLGVAVESNWAGRTNATENTFHNTDRFLRQHGFALFSVSVRPYSRRDLPAPFLHAAGPHPTRFGQPFQGDAVYLRDLAAPEQRELAGAYPLTKLAKLACLFELFRLPDCAAEVLNVFADRFAEAVDTELLLDALTPPLRGRALGYREYLAAFERDPELFTVPPEREWLWGELERAKEANRALQQHLSSLQASRGWRVARSLQWLAGLLRLRRRAG
jgi:hypothetical protein